MPDSDSCAVLFHVPARGVSRRQLADFAEQLCRTVTKGRTFCSLITGDVELQRLNREFRGKDAATDVLSFPAGHPGGSIGDLAISLDHARVQAKEHGHTIADEIRILMLHGALHLIGLDHECDNGEMARAEKQWRRRLGLPQALIERTSK
jgi:probable rRNA maturation factor